MPSGMNIKVGSREWALRLSDPRPAVYGLLISGGVWVTPVMITSGHT